MDNENEMYHIGYQHGHDGEYAAHEGDADYDRGYDDGVHDGAITFHNLNNL